MTLNKGSKESRTRILGDSDDKDVQEIFNYLHISPYKMMFQSNGAFSPIRIKYSMCQNLSQSVKTVRIM